MQRTRRTIEIDNASEQLINNECCNFFDRIAAEIWEAMIVWRMNIKYGQQCSNSQYITSDATYETYDRDR